MFKKQMNKLKKVYKKSIRQKWGLKKPEKEHAVSLY
jgi:hypothetical protein